MSIDFTRGVEIGTAQPPKEPRRRRLRRRGDSAESPEPPEETAESGVVEPITPKGPIVRQSRSQAKRGRYAPMASPAPTTTKQGEILNPAIISAPPDSEGIVIGRDRLSQGPVAHDPFTAYQAKRITSPSVLALGVIGSGKSSLLKTVYLLRPMILRQRRCVLLDRKDKDGQGEYSEIVDRFNGGLFRMVLGGGGDRINPLDPSIVEAIGAAGQVDLMRALAERANNDVTLDSWERSALREAMARTRAEAEADDRVPLLEDLTRLLGVVDGVVAWQDYSPAAKERVHQAGLGVRQTLEGALADELAGLFDGPTSGRLQLDSRITSFDISQLPVEGPATAMVLAVAQAWLLGTLRKDRGKGTNFLVEEGWDMVNGSIGRQINANQMLARGLGLCNIAALHHPAQVASDAEAISLLKEPQTIHIYRQDRSIDVETCVSLFNLDPSAADLLMKLEQGCHLLKIGNQPEIHVQHVRSALEGRLTDTDAAMTLRGGGDEA